MNLCTDCRLKGTCKEPFPHDECEDFEKEYKPAEILRLFRGMSKTMQRSIFLIMEATQEK